MRHEQICQTAFVKPLTIPDIDDETAAVIDEALTTREHGGGRLFDAPPIEPDEDVETEPGGDRPLDELF